MSFVYKSQAPPQATLFGLFKATAGFFAKKWDVPRASAQAHQGKKA